MNVRELCCWSLVVVILASLLVAPARVEAQCVATTFSQMIGVGFTFVFVLNGSYSCTRTMNSAMTCSPATGMGTTLGARATTGSVATMAVACGWNCPVCGMVTIDESNGLPVELMDFAIEDEVADASG